MKKNFTNPHLIQKKSEFFSCEFSPKISHSSATPLACTSSNRDDFHDMTSTLQPGDKAPDFTAVVVGGSYGEAQSISLSELLGKTVILYFYPKDDTPGCTTQACEVRDKHHEILAKDAVIFGVSVDSPKSHARFFAKHSLPFPLISDESREIVEAYGVWVEKSMYGKKYMGTERTTFVIDPAGKIQTVLRKIAPAAHMEAVLKSL